MVEKALSVKFERELPHLDTEVLENRAFRKRSAEIQLACGCVVALAITHSFTGQELPYPTGDSSCFPFGPRHEAANS